MIIDNIVVLIPALEPDNKLVNLVRQQNQLGHVHVVVIDDGSDDSSQAVFSNVQAYGTRVLHRWSCRCRQVTKEQNNVGDQIQSAAFFSLKDKHPGKAKKIKRCAKPDEEMNGDPAGAGNSCRITGSRAED